VHLKIYGSRLQVLVDQTLSEFLTWRHYGMIVFPNMSWFLLLIFRLELILVKLILFSRQISLIWVVELFGWTELKITEGVCFNVALGL